MGENQSTKGSGEKYEINIKPSKLGLSYDEYINCWRNAKESRKDRYTVLDEIEQTQLRQQKRVREEKDNSQNIGD